MNSFLHAIYVKKDGCGQSEVDRLAQEIKSELGPSGPSADSLPFLLQDADVRGLKSSGYWEIYIPVLLSLTGNPATGARDASSTINAFIRAKKWQVRE
jgi:hypothetical protein